jgi:hypothetical protein
MNLARILAVALAAAALAAPTALARPIGIHEPVSTPAPEASQQDQGARPDTAGNPSIAGATEPTSTVAADSGDGVAPLPFVITIVGTLLVGLGVGSGLHRMHVRRHAIELTA